MREDRERQRRSPLPFDVVAARERLGAFFGARPEVRAAFLFGSRARGHLRPSGDVDIAVWVDPSIAQEQRELLGLEWTGRIPDALAYPGDVDVLILNDAPPSLAWDVVCQPVVLYEAAPEIAGEVASRLRRDYRDELPRLERRRRRLLESIRRGEFGVSRQSH